MNVYEELREYVFGLDIYDTHEHLPANESERLMTSDVLAEYLIHYFCCDLVSAGLTLAQLAQARDSAQPIEKRWKLVQPFWEAARNTGYGRALDIVARDLYGLPRIDSKTIVPLNEAFKAARAAGGTYENVLKKRSKIKCSVLDRLVPSNNYDRRYFRPTLRLDDFIMAVNVGDLRRLAASAGMQSIHTLADLEEGCVRVLDKAIADGMICLKSGLAYHRALDYQKATATEAEAELLEMFSDRNFYCMEGVINGRTSKLQNYMMHFVCRQAQRRGLVFQIHTGIQEGNGNYVRHSDPTLLTNLFMEYPDVKFDCFHIGYPYQQSLAVLAKNFRNVFIDFCWAHIISPTASINALVEYLDSVPANKISGFGGDYCLIDGVYGHQYMARENVARALAIKVEQGMFDVAEAKRVAKLVMHDNPAALFDFAGPAGKPRKGRKG